MGFEMLKNRQEDNREEYRKNAITVPMYREDRERIEKAAKHLGLTRSGFMRMVARQYIDEMGVV